MDREVFRICPACLELVDQVGEDYICGGCNSTYTERETLSAFDAAEFAARVRYSKPDKPEERRIPTLGELL